MRNIKTGILGGLFVCLLSTGAVADDGDYVNIGEDLGNSVGLQDIADRAFENADSYWASTDPQDRDGTDDVLSSGEAVTEIYVKSEDYPQTADPLTRDIVNVTISVIDAWPDCEDTFDAVRSAVTLVPERADEIVAAVAVKRDCNCNNGGIWLDRRPHDRIRTNTRHRILDVPPHCSCSQVAMFAGIAGLPENREYNEDMTDEELALLVDKMTERVTTITERTSALQNRNDWQCGCTDINIAASMQGIEADDLRDGTYDKLAAKYTDEAGDTGLVVDSFGIVGLYPMEYWGDQEYASRDNSLRRQTAVYRGDSLILDPFHPSSQYEPHGDRNFENLGQHAHTSGNIPTDLFISEYIEGWNEAALALPPDERDPEQRNRVIELYNGSERTIDLANDLYFLEIYEGPGTAITQVAAPPALVYKKISLQADATFDFDKSDVRAEVSEDLQVIVDLLNEYDIVSEILITGHTCDIGTEEYNMGLSQRRASSIRDFLIDIGLEVDTIRIEGRGEAEPRVPNDSIANRSLNRRVDLTFVTRDGEQVETTVSAGDAPGTEKYEYDFLLPIPGNVVGDVEETTVANDMPSGDYLTGDMKPREVIGLNGAIGSGETFVVVFNDSDEVLTDRAQLVTGQLDFKPNETLVLRRLGGEMALNCRVYGYAHTVNFPVLPPTRTTPVAPPPPPGVKVLTPVSPN